jgi:hypothetical protein
LRRAFLNTFPAFREAAYRMTEENATGPGLDLVSDEESPSKPKRRRVVEEHYDADAEWLVLGGDSAMGERGTLGGTIAVLEHGGQFTGVPNTDLYTDQQIGWGRTLVGLVERHRWLSEARRLCTPECWADLVLRYTAPPANLRSDEGFGARQSCPSAEDIEKYGAVEPQRPTAFHTRRGTEAQLGVFAALALRHCADPGKLMIACLDPQKGRHSRVISAAFEKAKSISSTRHTEWRAAKELASRPRRASERRSILPAHVPHLPESEDET